MASSVATVLESVLFDLDGTLCDTDQLHFQAFQEILLSELPSFNDGQPITKEFYNTQFSGLANILIMKNITPGLPLYVQQMIADLKEKRYQELAMGGGLKPQKGLFRLLRWCEEHRLKKTVVTNAPREMASFTLKILQLDTIFAGNLVVGDECKAVKPDPAPYLKGMELISCSDPKHAVAFEDSVTGVQAAVAAGIPTIGILTSRDERALMTHGTLFCIKDLEDQALWDYLEKRLQP